IGRADLQTSLKGRGEHNTHAATIRVRSTLVACEIALSAACVMAGVLLFHSFASLLLTSTGFETERVVTTEINLGGPQYQTVERRMVLLDGVVDDVRRLPGVRNVAIATQLPLTGTGSMSAFSAEGGTTAPMERPRADVRSVTEDYFQTMAVPLQTGRLIASIHRDPKV